MGKAAILVSMLAAIGPIALPFAFAQAGRDAIFAFCLTNLITLSPMIGIVIWGRYSFPNDIGLYFFTLLFIVLAFWSLIASVSITTSDVFRKR